MAQNSLILLQQTIGSLTREREDFVEDVEREKEEKERLEAQLKEL